MGCGPLPAAQYHDQVFDRNGSGNPVQFGQQFGSSAGERFRTAYPLTEAMDNGFEPGFMNTRHEQAPAEDENTAELEDD